MLASLKRLKAGARPDDWIPRITEVIKNASNALNDLRRVSRDMHPAAIEHLGLMKAIESLLENFESSNQTIIDSQVAFDERGLDGETQVHVYRMIQECLTNISRHAKAETCRVALWSADEALHILIEDDGIGMDSGSRRTGQGSGLGLFSIDERVRIVNGTWECLNAQFGGLRVKITIPCSSEGG